jgi:multidrug efflux system outer membrane protein
MADRHAVGEIDRSVALRWEVFLSEQELALAAAEGAVATAGAELNAALGRDALAPVAIAPPDPAEDPATALAGLDEPGFLARVGSLSPDLAAARAASREAEAGVTAARAGWLPALTAAGSYGWKQDDDPALDGYRTWSAGLAFSYPLFDGLRNLARHRQASARARAAAHAVRAARQALEREAARLFHEHSTARRQRTTARAAHEQAEAHLAIVADRFRLGLVSNVTLVDAQTARDRAAAGVVSAEVRVALALAAMERLLGRAAALPESVPPAPRSRP